MAKRALIFAFVMSASLAFGQLDSNSITVTASRSTTLQPDQAIFSVDVSSGLDTTIDDVIAALAGSGILIANFQGVNNSFYIYDSTALQPSIHWSFTLPVSFSKFKD